ncbi:MAG: sodium/solute symporter [Bacteroidota bacterium]
MLDLLIVITYFVVILIMALRGGKAASEDKEAYFLSNRNLRWPSIALSTIATNVQGYQFLGMMGSAYLYGLAQANLEINAIQGLWMAAFIFIPLYLREKIITITQFIKKKLGTGVALAYSIGNMFLLGTLGLGAALFWGAYAADLVFSEYLGWLGKEPLERIMWLIGILGVIAALYTWVGGLSAVVKTDIIQFLILTAGGIAILVSSIYYLGGWGVLYEKTPELMHLHLPADHPKLPWIAIPGMLLLNINYWCANQSVVQRSLAARSLREAQVGLMVGGLMKYVMALIIIVPGIALAGVLGADGLADPDQAFPYLVKAFLPVGLKGLIVCALFASMMSTVDSTFNSLATMWSIDMYQPFLNPKATDKQLVQAGRNAILFFLLTGVAMGCLLIWVKLRNPEDAFTHTLNELRYYLNTGFVVVVCAAALLGLVHHKLALGAFLVTIPLHLLFQWLTPDMNYFVRAMWVIVIAFIVVAGPSLGRKKGRMKGSVIEFANIGVRNASLWLLASLVLAHIVFH